MPERGADDLPFVVAAQAGDASAFATLFDRWFDRVFDVAFRIVHNRDTAAEVAQDVFLVAWQQLGTLEQPASFGGWVLRTSRNRALNRLDRERRSTSFGIEETTMEIDRRTRVDGAAADPGSDLDRDEAHDLVWAAARGLGERDASLLDLHLRHELGVPEIAEALGVTTNNAHQLLFRLKGKLAGAIRSFVLWSGGRPACPELTAALRESGRHEFDAGAVKAIERHATSCSACQNRQRLRLAPEAMFAAVPILAAGAVLKAKAAAALDAAGIPVPATSAPSSVPRHDEPPGPSGPSGGEGGGTAPGSDQATASATGSRSDHGSGPAAASSPPAARRRVTRRRVVGAAVVIALVALIVGLLAEPTGHDRRVRVDSIATDAGQVGTTTNPGRRTAAPSTTTGAGPAASDLPGVGVPAPGGVPSGTGAPAPRAPTSAPAVTAGPTTVPTPPPTIDGFRARATQPGPPCSTGQVPVVLVWSQSGGTSASVVSPTPGASVPVVDNAAQTATACVPIDAAGGPVPATFSLTVTGPGGHATRTTTTP
ncbi:MAG TPA: sigma-70 family RNA polymerase sigma factor [Acidimicrobiales bacterium]|nr:sigma-70 family RNA polymerase sigma factor [Acidimicrobiales bacterium]